MLRRGDPVDEVPRLAAEVGARRVVVTADSGPYGSRRDRAVAAALDACGRELVRVGTPYAVAPGTLRTVGGDPFRVFGPFSRAWARQPKEPPLPPPAAPRWRRTRGRGVALPTRPDLGGTAVLVPGEQAGLARLDAFLGPGVGRYADRRDVPAAPGTSRLSVYLKYGRVHPRQVLARLAGDASPGAEAFRSELAWRDFYADVLAARPESVRRAVRDDVGDVRVDDGEQADARFAAWATGRTGFPIVDAGMRQLLAEAWMHNRVRMITASFLVKDLHLDWRRGARHFMRHLQDGDLASNTHGWQWVAGTGTDAAPYDRVFNPVLQGRRFDPDGTYVRRWIPELAAVPTAAVHEPWRLSPAGGQGSLLGSDAPPALAGYPAPIVDHAAERREALARYAEARAVRS